MSIRPGLALAAFLIAPSIAAAQDAQLDDGRTVSLVDGLVVANVAARDVSVACARGGHCYVLSDGGVSRAVDPREAIRVCTGDAPAPCFAVLGDGSYRTKHGVSFTSSRGAPVAFTWRPERFTEATCAFFREHSPHDPPEVCDAYEQRSDAAAADDESCRGDVASTACRRIRSNVLSAESPAQAIRIFGDYLRIPYLTWRDGPA